MKNRIQIVTCKGINRGFRAQIRTWTNDVLGKAQPLSDICVTIWATTEELKTLILQLRERGIEDHLVPWPLLSIEDGYYPNEQTISKFHVLIHFGK